jgi:hypothetical protein
LVEELAKLEARRVYRAKRLKTGDAGFKPPSKPCYCGIAVGRAGGKEKKNMVLSKFSPGVAEKIGYYVYRLIDPRNGNTFYVGKGKGDRVFTHAKGVLKDIVVEAKDEEEKEDETTLKIETIKEIQGAGLEVIHIIHRHGMDEPTAYEVEGALIDAYSGFANIVAGHSSDRSAMHALEIEWTFARPVIKTITEKCLIIKIRQSTVSERGSVYEAVRWAWKLGKKHDEVQYVLAVINGVVKGIYKHPEWYRNKELGRWEFHAGKEPVEKEVTARYLDHQIPEEYRKPSMANPCLYTW